jgi:hypothetical protein
VRAKNENRSRSPPRARKARPAVPPLMQAHPKAHDGDAAPAAAPPPPRADGRAPIGAATVPTLPPDSRPDDQRQPSPSGN